jgi:ribulose-5-phosphate 4-epimerase/fuculose-1-phosphate aldolase
VPDNSLPKIRDVKEVAPHAMLVTSKRNDDDKCSLMELTQRALTVKANMFFEFKKYDYNNDDGNAHKLFHINVFDPLGNHWYDGLDIDDAVVATMKRLSYLISVTRQKTIKSEISKSDVMSAFFKNVCENAKRSEKEVKIPDEQEFVDVVRKHAETFYQIFNPGKDVKRFLGNASLRPTINIDSTRCMRGMPSFKKGNMIFVSQRNIDKQFIDLDHFVPCYMENGKLYYCGDKKPSVDAPIQIRLYEALHNINYIIHSHCYINGAISTNKPIPCGAIEEVDEVLRLIDNTYGLRNLDYYAINLKGHGSLLMAKDVSLMHDVEYVGRKMPEIMFEKED